jgi:putative phage-type endonuclease
MIVDLEQGTSAWKEWRRGFRMASETAALLRISPWYPRNAFELWEVKSGRTEVRVTPAMARGSELEGTARALYEIQRSDLMVPYLVKGEGDYAASLDGLSFDGDRIIEIKCPFKGSASDLWARAARGQVPPHYACQVQVELMASGAEYCDFAVYAGDTHQLTIIEVRHDLGMQARIRAAWDAFWPDYLAGRAPGEDYVGLLKRSIGGEKRGVLSEACSGSLSSRPPSKPASCTSW